MAIQRLDGQVASHIHGQYVFPSLEAIVEALVLNSLEANATKVTIKIDETTLSACVQDNGLGIRDEDFAAVGRPGYTSKAGKSGVSLAAIGAVSGSLEVATHGRDSRSSISGVWAGFFEIDPPPSQGTVVVVGQAFLRIPVRRNEWLDQKSNGRFWRSFRSRLFALLARHLSCKVEVFLRAGGLFKRRCAIDGCGSRAILYSQIFGPVEMSRFDNANEVLSLSLVWLYSEEPTQFVYLNDHQIDPGRYTGTVLQMLSNQSVVGKSLRHNVAYLLDLKGPYPGEETQSMLEADWTIVLGLIRTHSRTVVSSPKKRVRVEASNPPSISHEQIAEMQVLRQLNSQFFLAVHDRQLYAVDPHACDERINLEHIISDYLCDIRELSASVRLEDPMHCTIGQVADSMVGPCQTILSDYGFRFHCHGGTAVVTHLPEIIHGVVNASTLSSCLVLFAKEIERRQKRQVSLSESFPIVFSNLPLIVTEAFISRSCKTSIKFGTVLQREEMEYLLRILSQASMPFVCAHGRPTLYPLTLLMILFNEDYELESRAHSRDRRR